MNLILAYNKLRASSVLVDRLIENNAPACEVLFANRCLHSWANVVEALEDTD